MIIDVDIGAKIVTQDETEKGKLSDLPAIAERLNRLLWEGKRSLKHV